MMREIGPEERCDRCDHPAKYHWNADRRGWIDCQIASGHKRAGAKAPKCWCDGFVPKARTA